PAPRRRASCARSRSRRGGWSSTRARWSRRSACSRRRRRDRGVRVVSPIGADASARGAAAMPDARLDALDAAAVGLLEPLIHATDVDVVGLAGATAAGPGGAAPGGTGPGKPAGGWRIGLASALDRLAEAALDLELIGLGHAVGLLRAHLLGVARPDDVALELASAEGWVSDAIAFCSGQLPVDEAPTLIE